MPDSQIQILLRVDRQQALYKFLRDFFIPLLQQRGYQTEDLLQAAATWLYQEGNNKKAANHLLDAASEFD
jgi:ATP/maltotriose-dependent transcriptional regulator MalT